MLSEFLLGQRKLDNGINPVIKAYIISEVLLWSAWNFIAPIAAIFVTTNIKGGNVEVAAASYSIYLTSRVLFELLSGRFLAKTNDRIKFLVSISGISLMSISYIGFAFSHDILTLGLFYTLLGMGLGLASPAKNSLFSIHLDKSKEASEWGVADATAFLGMAIAGVVGGIIAKQYGFQALFILAAILNLISIIPYLLRIKLSIVSKY